MTTLRTYATEFTLATTPDVVVEAALAPQRWLPSLPNVVALERITDGDGLGSRYRTRVRAVVPYTLAWEMQVASITSSEIVWHASGDLQGTARWRFEALDGRTVVRSTWAVRPAARWMTMLWWLARGVFVANHDAIMRRGAEHLAAHLDVELVSYAHHPGRGQVDGRH